MALMQKVQYLVSQRQVAPKSLTPDFHHKALQKIAYQMLHSIAICIAGDKRTILPGETDCI
jgi:hypothetical protein